MSPFDVMKRTNVLLALYSLAGEVSGVTDGNGLLAEEVGEGEAVEDEVGDGEKVLTGD